MTLLQLTSTPSQIGHSVLLALLTCQLAAPAALAEPAPPTAPEPAAEAAPASAKNLAPSESDAALRAELRHVPKSVASSARELQLLVEIINPHLVAAAQVHYRRVGARNFTALPLKLNRDSRYVVTLPATAIAAPGVEYYFSLTQLHAAPTFVGSAAQPFVTQLVPDALEARENYLAERLQQRRSTFHGGGDYVHFGSSRVATLAGPPQIVRDAYYRIEGAYTYRPLRTITEFSLRLGVVRGTSPAGAANTDPASGGTHVGLNYGAPSVLLRFLDGWHGELELLTSITEVGFALGAGGASVFGDPYGAHLKLGFETVQVFGTRFYSQLALPYGSWLSLVPSVEVTDMPHAGRYGARLLLEARSELGAGVALTLRGGYQARVFDSGGPSLGAGVEYAY